MSNVCCTVFGMGTRGLEKVDCESVIGNSCMHVARLSCTKVFRRRRTKVFGNSKAAPSRHEIILQQMSMGRSSTLYTLMPFSSFDVTKRTSTDSRAQMARRGGGKGRERKGLAIQQQRSRPSPVAHSTRRTTDADGRCRPRRTRKGKKRTRPRQSRLLRQRPMHSVG